MIEPAGRGQTIAANESRDGTETSVSITTRQSISDQSLDSASQQSQLTPIGKMFPEKFCLLRPKNRAIEVRSQIGAAEGAMKTATLPPHALVTPRLHYLPSARAAGSSLRMGAMQTPRDGTTYLKARLRKDAALIVILRERKRGRGGGDDIADGWLRRAYFNYSNTSTNTNAKTHQALTTILIILERLASSAQPRVLAGTARA